MMAHQQVSARVLKDIREDNLKEGATGHHKEVQSRSKWELWWGPSKCFVDLGQRTRAGRAGSFRQLEGE